MMRPSRHRDPLVPPRLTRLAHALGSVVMVLAFLAAFAVWHFAFRPPPVEVLPLPGNLVALEIPTGQYLLRESGFVADYDDLAEAFEAQVRRAYCGVASSVIVLNAMRKSGSRLTQDSLFNDAASNVRSSLEVTFKGMSLADLGDILRAHRADVTIHYASDVSIDTFRTIARENLATQGDFVLVNYQRARLGQGEIGHISPLAAYNAQADRFLVLDVASYKFPPAWVKTEDLWEAMTVTVSSSGRSRGFAVVREGARAEHRAPSRETLQMISAGNKRCCLVPEDLVSGNT